MQLIWLTSSITKTLPTKFPHISKTNPYQLFYITIFHHPKFSIIKGYCRTSRFRTSRLNHRAVLAKSLHSNMILPVTSLREICPSSKTNICIISFLKVPSTVNSLTISALITYTVPRLYRNGSAIKCILHRLDMLVYSH